jgi:hypothetical protein
MSHQNRKLSDMILNIVRENVVSNKDTGEDEEESGPNIIDFIESSWGLNGELYPAQRVILKTFYGIPLDDVSKSVEITNWRKEPFEILTEKEYLEYLYHENRCNVKEVIPGHAFNDMTLAIGRRGGKTYLSSCIASFETDKVLRKRCPQEYYGISPSDTIRIVTVATSKDQAKILYDNVQNHFTVCPRFLPYKANITQSLCKFQTIEDIKLSGRFPESVYAKSSILVTFYSCIAKGLRGSGNLSIILDEAAHFQKEGQASLEEIYKAIAPSTAAFTPKEKGTHRPKGDSDGKIIMISSPLGKSGYFYENYDQGYKHDNLNRLCISAPSWEINPTISAQVLLKFYSDNTTSFFTEFGAQFTDRTRGWIENEEDLFACIDLNLKPATGAPTKRPHFLGIDIGVTKGKDGTAFAIGHINDQNKIVLDLLEYLRAGEPPFEDLQRLDFDMIADHILELSKRYYISEGLLDSWCGIPLEQAIHKKGLIQIKSESIKRDLESQIYKNFKDMMWDKRLILYDYPIPPDKVHCGYIEELLELQAEFHSKYVITVAAPAVEGKHDDRSDALVRMVWLASQHIGKKGYIADANTRGKTLGAPMHRIQTRRRALLGGSDPKRIKPGRRH